MSNTTHYDPNPFAANARAKKLSALIRQASRLVDHPHDHIVAGLLAASLRGWNAGQWVSLAAVAGVRPPSPLTASLVIAEFETRAKGPVVTIEVQGREYDVGFSTRSDLFILTAQVTPDGVRWLSAEYMPNEGSYYGEAEKVSLDDAARELGDLEGYSHLALQEAEKVR